MVGPLSRLNPPVSVATGRYFRSMLCLGCGVWAEGRLCAECRLWLRPAPERVLPGVGVVQVGFLHQGAARRLVHQLKYRGVVAAASLLAGPMTPLLPPDALLVPVPRRGWRRIRYGVDPAVEFARALATRTGHEISNALSAQFWGRSRAGHLHGSTPRFNLRAGHEPGPSLVLVDDVVTSGATLVAAAAVLGPVAGAITATGAVGGRARHSGDERRGSVSA